MANKKRIKVEKQKFISPVNINRDIWFYPLPKSIDFVVWVQIGIERKAVQFNVTHKKLSTYMWSVPTKKSIKPKK